MTAAPAATARDKLSIMVVDDDEVFRIRLCRAFEDRGWEALACADGETALRTAESSLPDLALIDLRLVGMNGLDVVKELRERDLAGSIIMLTGYGSIATAITATKLGADHYLSKPSDADQILEAYRKIQAEDISQAAKLLGLHRRSLQRKLSKYPPKV